MSDDNDEYLNCVNRFIELANTMKGEGVATSLVSGALMSASGVYATYVAAGEKNNAGLTPSGVDKVASAYKAELQRIQEARKAEVGT